MRRQIVLILLLSALFGEFIGVLPIGEHQQTHVHAVGQQHVDAALRGLDAGGVAVEEHRDVRCEALHQSYLFVRESGAARGHHVLHAHLVHGHHVGVALHHIDEVRLRDGLLGFEEAVEFFLLAVDAALGGVDVFLADALGGGVEHASAEADHFARDAAYGEDHASGVAVVHRAVVASDGEARLHEEIFLIARLEGRLGEGAALLGGEAGAERFHHVVAEAAPAEIGEAHGASVGRVVHLVLKPVERPFVEGEERVALRLLRPFFGREFLLHDGDAVAFGQPSERFGIGNLLVLHEEAHGAAAFAAGPAAAGVACGRHGERGGAVVVKRAEPLPARTGLLEVDEFRDDIVDLCRLVDFRYGRAVDHVFRFQSSRWPAAS